MISWTAFPQWAIWTKCPITWTKCSQASLLPQAPETSPTFDDCNAKKLLCRLSRELADLMEKYSQINCPTTPSLIPIPHTWLFLALFILPCKRKALFCCLLFICRSPGRFSILQQSQKSSNLYCNNPFEFLLTKVQIFLFVCLFVSTQRIAWEIRWKVSFLLNAQSHLSLFLILLMPTVRGAKEKWGKLNIELVSQRHWLQQDPV